MGALKNQRCFHFVSPSPSRADLVDWRATKALKKNGTEGFVFSCDSSTMPDLQSGTFGFYVNFEDLTKGIFRGMPLFLYNTTDKCLYGIFEVATTNRDMNLRETNGFSNVGKRETWFRAQQCKVTIFPRNGVSVLDEEAFSSILGHMHHHNFNRIDLTGQQVQQLQTLFETSLAPVRSLKPLADSRSTHNMPQLAVNCQDPESPRLAYKSDTDYGSDCSSRGANSGEDEWIDETRTKSNEHQSSGNTISEELRQMTLNDEKHFSESKQIKKKVTDDCDHNDDEAISVETSQIVADGPGNSLLLRLQENGSAVRSSCSASGASQMFNDNDQENTDIVSAMQLPYSRNENAFFIPIQAFPLPQRHGGMAYGETKWGDQKKYFRGSCQNIQKQGFNQDRARRLTKHHHRQQMPGKNQRSGQFRYQKFPNGYAQFPFCMQRHDQINNYGHFSSPVLMPLNGEALTFKQLHTTVNADSDSQGLEVANEIQIGFQQLLQNGFVFMPSPMHAYPPPLLVNSLHSEILKFAKWTRPSAEIQTSVESAIDCVRKGVKTIWPDADIEVFGSIATGLCLQHSDVDIVVIDAPWKQYSDSMPAALTSAALIRELATELKTHEWCESIITLENASMPVLKCRCRPQTSVEVSLASSIAVDITVGGRGVERNSWYGSSTPSKSMEHTTEQCTRVDKITTYHTGSAARDYVLCKIREFPALAPLVLLLKSFLHHRGLNNVYSGGLGSFSLTLLVAFYLEGFAPTHIEASTNGGTCDLPPSPRSPAVPSSLFSSPECSDDSDTACSRNEGDVEPSNSTTARNLNSKSLGKHYVSQASESIEKALSLWDEGGSYLGNILLGFLQLFGFDMDLSCERIVLKGMNGNPGGIFKREDRHCALWIDDPLRPGVNVGAGSFGMVHVQTCFKEMLQVLTRCGIMTPVHLQCEHTDCQDLGVMKRLPNLSRLVVETNARR